MKRVSIDEEGFGTKYMYPISRLSHICCCCCRRVLRKIERKKAKEPEYLSECLLEEKGEKRQ
jgi:hypothetical protein